MDKQPPKTRLEIYGCSLLGSEDMVLKLYNDQEVERRVRQPYVWFLLGTLLENNDCATLIIRQMREVIKQDPLFHLLNPFFFDTTFRTLVGYYTPQTISTTCATEILTCVLTQLKSLFMDNIDEPISTINIDIGNLYVPMGPMTPYHETMKSFVTLAATTVILVSLLLDVSPIEITIQSHHRDSLFSQCLALLKNQSQDMTKTILGSTLWLNKQSTSLKVIECLSCAWTNNNTEKEEGIMRKMYGKRKPMGEEEESSSWCTQQ